MKKRIKAKWLKALLSGEYQQGISFLNRDGKFCCLGVLYDTLEGRRWVKESKESLARGAGSRGQTGLLDTKTRERCGLTITEQCELSTMNDSGKTFGQIAKHIEAKL